ncbi:alpha/beta fold hydrolase [Reyranella sp.]|uniref:alpha/beta fold hydrolase n=1 Tax=Reyranella sp. TaxID=1929291 RepID=UPI001205912F|nr:alpha/beta fold hydrolase [Reyranella sp.]TAJ84257.1 MAG: alpha/beta fold hydrolase [Reyranella sp.]
MATLPLPIAALAAASYLAPTLVAPFFRRMMLTPRRHVRPPPVLAVPEADTRIDLGNGLVAWRWGDPAIPTVLLVHGFEGNRAQFGAILEALLARGLSVVALDVPAHGESVGDELTAVKFIAAIERTLDRIGPVHAVVGHSMGGAMSLFSIAHRGGARRVALVSAPSSLKRELQRFAKMVGLSKRGARAFIASVEKHVGRPAADFDVRHIVGKVNLPVLMIHDQTDRQVPVAEAARSAHMLPDAELIVTRGLGHNRLLADPAVVTAIVDFVSRQEMTGSASIS